MAQAKVKNELIELAQTLKGKPIREEGAGYYAEGVIESVSADDTGFKIIYIDKVNKLRHQFSGTWEWARVYRKGASLELSVSMVGTVLIYP